jgi:hypothetical protein
LIFYLHSVVATDAGAWLALGWTESRWRDRKPSVGDDIVVLEWTGESEPPVPYQRSTMRQAQETGRRFVALLESIDRDHHTPGSAECIRDARRALGTVDVYFEKLFNGEVRDGT